MFVTVICTAALAACGGSGHQAVKPSVAACTKQIVAHPSGTNPKLWPACKGLSQRDLWKATLQAMSQGATG